MPSNETKTKKQITFPEDIRIAVEILRKRREAREGVKPAWSSICNEGLILVLEANHIAIDENDIAKKPAATEDHSGKPKRKPQLMQSA